MKYFLLGTSIPVFAWIVSYFVSLGWYAGKPKQVTDLNIVSLKDKK